MMKILVNKIIYHWFQKIPINNKIKEFQISWLFNLYLDIYGGLDLTKECGNIFSINLNILGLFILRFYKDKECDHCGFTFQLNIFGLDIEYSNRDIRHWDYDNDKYEELDEKDII